MDLKNKSMYEIINVKGKGLDQAVPIKDHGLELLKNMLKISPKERISPKEAL